MTLLARAEDTYLNILRVVILAIATIAMVLTLLGLLVGGWLFLANSGSAHSHVPPVSEVTLGDYVREQKTSDETSSGSGGAEEDSGAASKDAPKEIQNAAKNIIVYARKKIGATGGDLGGLRTELYQNYQGFPEQYRSAYGSSLESLTNQLLISKGKILSTDQIVALIKWHQDKFTQAVNEEQANRTQKALAGQQLATFGAAAFLAFLLLVFCFIFVKIERNLRAINLIGPFKGEAL